MPKQPALGTRGVSGSVLKTIAIVAMAVDHIAWAFVPTASALGVVMHFIGRITGPTMFYFIAEGYHHTRDANRYTLRLGVFALVSWFPFYFFEFGTLPSLQSFTPVGVIYTLFLGLLALRARHEVKNRWLGTLLVIACLLASVIGDWGVTGVAVILLFDVFQGSYKRQCLAVGALFALTSLPDLAVGLAAQNATGIAVGVIQLGQFVPLLLLGFYNGRRGGGGPLAKWFFYVVYPLHLLVLGLIKWVWLPLA